MAVHNRSLPSLLPTIPLPAPILVTFDCYTYTLCPFYSVSYASRSRYLLVTILIPSIWCMLLSVLVAWLLSNISGTILVLYREKSPKWMYTILLLSEAPSLHHVVVKHFGIKYHIGRPNIPIHLARLQNILRCMTLLLFSYCGFFYCFFLLPDFSCPSFVGVLGTWVCR